MKTGNPDHLNLLLDISELTHLVSDSKDIDAFLLQVVECVAGHLHADVGSIYLLEENSAELVLRATVGLNPGSVGHIRMKIGEGLVGTTLQHMEPVCDGSACDNPRFKFFPEAHEEPYRSFLSVPICRGAEKIGVLVVQHRQPDFFSRNDVLSLRAIAAQLAGTIANARVMITTPEPAIAADNPDFLKNLRFVRGEATVPGVALAPAAPLNPIDPLLAQLPEDAFHNSLQAYQRAMQETVEQLRHLQTELVRRLPESAALIFEAHHMILKDPRFVQQIADLIAGGRSAVAAVRTAANRLIALFAASANPYIREKSHDIEDLAHRLVSNLRKDKPLGSNPADPHIVIASQLYPSDVLKLATESVAGIILVSGGVTSHVAIVARSLKIPMVIARNQNLLQVPEGISVLMDAEVGTVYIDPSEQVKHKYQAREQARKQTAGQAVGMKADTLTRDAVRVRLLANINLLGELALARELKAEGIGLYRSEFPFIVRSVFPSEEEQRVIYARLFERMGHLPVNIRTLDIGGDKVLPYLDSPREANPELGLRSIRFSLRHPEIFAQQIRAILRAAAQAGQVGILFPMISSLDEFRTARRAVEDALASLEAEGLEYHHRPRIGAMIELPAVVPIIDALAAEADFLSLGTNDFIQYMLAVDRTNEQVAAYYQPFHPGIIRSLALIADCARRFDKDLAVCGEVAHDPRYIPFLLGIGVRTLSVDPQFLPLVQRTVMDLSLDRSKALAEQLLVCASEKEIAALLAEFQASRRENG